MTAGNVAPSNGVGGRLRTSPLLEAEFERFAAALAPMDPYASEPSDLLSRRKGTRRGPGPRTTAATIHERGLELLEAEGVEAFTIRRLAADLQISTRTLYKRIGSQGRLIRAIIDLHLSRLDLTVHTSDSWEVTAWMWCLGLHKTLSAHPQLTRLMAEDDVERLCSHSDKLAEVAVQEGVPHALAIACCRSLAVVTANDALRTVRAARNIATVHLPHPAPPTAATSNLFRTVQWIIAGARQQVSAEWPASNQRGSATAPAR